MLQFYDPLGNLATTMAAFLAHQLSFLLQLHFPNLEFPLCDYRE